MASRAMVSSIMTSILPVNSHHLFHQLTSSQTVKDLGEGTTEWLFVTQCLQAYVLAV